jgi:hypothetical protein
VSASVVASPKGWQVSVVGWAGRGERYRWMVGEVMAVRAVVVVVVNGDGVGGGGRC